MGVFKDIGFSLELEYNLKEVVLIEVKFNLQNRNYPPYKKEMMGFFTFIFYQTTHHTS